MESDKNLYNRMNIGFIILLTALIGLICILYKITQEQKISEKEECFEGYKYKIYSVKNGKEFYKAEKNNNKEFIKCK